MLAAALAALAVALAIAATRPARPAGMVTVVVARRDVPAGATLAVVDLAAAGYPRELAPPGALTAAASATGRQVTGPLLRGEVVTGSRLVPRGGGAAWATGLVIVHLLADDPAALDLLRPGTRATLYPGGGGPALTRSALVVTVDPADQPDAESLSAATAGSARGVVVALESALVDRIFAGQRADGGPPVVSVAANPP